MNKEYQREQLRRTLANPLLQSGLYLIDTDLEDVDIENLIEGLCGCNYQKEALMVTSCGSPFEMFVIGLSHKCETDEIIECRMLWFKAENQQKDIILYSLLIAMMRRLSRAGKTIIHIYGDLDLASLNHTDLSKLNESLMHSDKIIIIACKNKGASGTTFDPIIKRLVLKEDNRFRNMENRKGKVHITYKHDDAYDDAKKAIITGLEKNGIPYSIDDIDIKYRDNIDNYEKEIGASECIIMFVTPSYLYSIDCMFEMTEMFKNGLVRERTLPLVDLGYIKRNADGLGQIKDYWHGEKVKRLERAKNEPGHSDFLIAEIKKIEDIINTLDEFWIYICRDYTGSYEDLIKDEAALLIEEIQKVIRAVSNDETFVPTGGVAPVAHRTVTQHGEKSIYIEHNTGIININ